VTYKIKDSQGTIASGNLGEVADPFRQVQYVVLRAQRYSAYDLVDLRLSALNLYAGHETEVEDFEDGDGTLDGTLGSDEIAEADSSLSGAANQLLRMFWTGWWPILHQVVLNPLNCTEELLHFGLDLLNRIEVFVDSLAEWFDDIIDFIGDKAAIIIAILGELFETVFEFTAIRHAMRFAVAGWVIVDTLKFMDITGAALLASVAMAALLTIAFVGFVYASAGLAATVFGWDEAAVIWLIVLIQALLLLGNWFWGRLDPNGIASTMIRVSQWTSNLFGPFADILLLVCWWAWATLIFLLSIIALAALNMALLFLR
jgi:hypothetical protein